MTRLGEVIETIEASWRISTVRMEVHGASSTWRFWQAGDRRRMESEPGGSLTITAGELSWRNTPEAGALEYRGTSMSYWPIEHLLQLNGLLAARLDVIGEAVVAGRHAVQVRARPRPGPLDIGLSYWQIDDRGLDVWVDRERGIGLKDSRVEVTAVTFDEVLDDSLFEKPTQIGEIRPAQVRARSLTVEEAAAGAPFALMAPRLLPEGTRLLTWQGWGDEPWKWVGAVYVVDPGARYSLNLHLSSQGMAGVENDAWRVVEVAGVRVDACEDKRNRLQPSIARIVRDNIFATVRSDLPLNTVVQIAASIEPL